MEVTLSILADALVANDTEQDCPFCQKNEWGAKNHHSQCPFAMAYLVMSQSAQQSVQSDGACDCGSTEFRESIRPVSYCINCGEPRR